MATEKLDTLPGGHVPDPNGFVLAGGGQVLAVSTEGHGVNRAAVAEHKDLLAAARLPHMDDAVGASGGQQVTLGVESHGLERGTAAQAEPLAP